MAASRAVRTLVTNGERLATTPEYPCYKAEWGWIAAGELRAGMHVRKADGGWGVVRAVRVEQRAQRMYNLTVEKAHTFFVGEGRWLVHNSCNPLAKSLDAAGKPRPIPHAAAHHIVAKQDPRAAGAAAILNKHGVDIHDAGNGVWLPTQQSGPLLGHPNAYVHDGTPGLHGFTYYQEVERDSAVPTSSLGRM